MKATTPYEVKLTLERLTLEMAVTVTGVHSLWLDPDGIVYAIFDIAPDESGCGLHFTFPLPYLVSRNDLRQFGEWLASPDYTGGVTVH